MRWVCMDGVKGNEAIDWVCGMTGGYEEGKTL